MTNDPTIREQTHRYFLQEAPELLQILEQDLLTLREDYSINKINNLMRTTHTLKGAAASIGLETIKTVAHSLEDIFKALFRPGLSIDREVEALLFEGFECLRQPLTAEFTGGQVNEAEVLDRTATVFARLQEKLGDCFDQDVHLPSSIELGFDVTQSIFEVGVAQRLDELATTVASADPTVVANTLRSQSEVFIGLAESLGLPGFGAIAQTAIAAMDTHPEQVLTIAQITLADFQAAHAAVLNGDRTQGGQPSLALQQLAALTTDSPQLTETENGILEEIFSPSLPQESATQPELGTHEQIESWAVEEIFSPSLPQESATQPELGTHEQIEGGILEDIFSPSLSQESATQPESGSVTSSADSELNLSESQDEESANPLIELIWGGQAVLDSPTSNPGNPEPASSISAINPQPKNLQSSAVNRTGVSGQGSEVPIKMPVSRYRQPIEEPTPIPPKEQVSQARTVRVNVEHLEQLNYSIGELLTNQNRQSLQTEQVQAGVRSLLARLKQHQQRLGELQDWSDRLFVDAERRRAVSNQDWQSHFRFDSLELDRYSESQLLVQSVLEDAVQLGEAAEAIDLFTRQSNQTVEKQRRLLTSARDALMEARMLPLGELFSRFPRVLQQLEVLHNKPVALELSGTEVLVDKVVVEKLYDPLLHLVRNAFAHGIESPTFRQQWGKADKGQIEICAYHRGKSLVIEVRDDGQGLDFEAIRQRAVQRQFVSPEQASSLNEAQLIDLLFEPGFSTASQVNDLSGRGVGLDLVRTQLQALQGSVSVYSEHHRGTTFVLQIPLTLTIAKLLLAQAGDRVYALLANAIEQIIIPQSHQIRSWEDGKALRWGTGADERLVPVHRLSKVLDYFSRVPEPPISSPKRPFVSKGQVMPIILIRSQDTLLGLEVDQLLGEQELVIRPLGPMITPPSYVYGGSILPDGQLTLVLDGAELMQCVFNQQSDTTSTYNLPSSTPHFLPSSQEQRQLPVQIRAALPGSVEPDYQARPEKMVLLVDDSITVRQTLALTLQKAGYRVLQAKDGYEAIEQLQHQTDIQLVICDIEMPRMNGFEFLKHRQQDPTLANIPIVILTSRSGEKHRLIASELGATDYITKPFVEHKLLATVTDVIEKNTLDSVSR
jgi:chemotaxis protein histidine kinase CheA/ActR/RegA family two-component response regulator